MINLNTGEIYTPPEEKFEIKLDDVSAFTEAFRPRRAYESKEWGEQLDELLKDWHRRGRGQAKLRAAAFELSRAGLYSLLYGAQRWLINNGTPEQQTLAASVRFTRIPDGYAIVAGNGRGRAASLLEAAMFDRSSEPFENMRADIIEFIAQAPIDTMFERPSKEYPGLFRLTSEQCLYIQGMIEEHPQLTGHVAERVVRIAKLAEGDV